MDRFERTGWNDEKYILQNYYGNVKVSLHNVFKDVVCDKNNILGGKC